MNPSQLFEQNKADAENGSANAQNNLGIFYRDGQGVPKDEVEAVNWFREAAEQNNASAQCNLGDLLRHRRRCSKG